MAAASRFTEFVAQRDPALGRALRELEERRASDPVFRQRGDIMASLEDHSSTQSIADRNHARELVEARMKQGLWQPSRDAAPDPSNYEGEVLARGASLVADAIELVIVRLLAATHPMGQFAVAETGAVFTASTRGFSRPPDRIYLTGLSPLLDAIAVIVYEFRQATGPGIGGRFYESEGRILDAESGVRILEVRT